MRLVVISAVVWCGCATPPARMSWAEAVSEGTPHLAPERPETALERFVATAGEARQAAPPGSRMPDAQVEHWQQLLDAVAPFADEPADPAWLPRASALRIRLEAELQADARSFGDVRPELADRVTRLLRKLSTGISRTSPPPPRAVDPHSFRWPVEPVLITSPWGDRTHPINGTPQFHAGLDLHAPLSATVVAADDGVVVFSGWNGAHGNQVELRHDGRWSTRYSHLERALVTPGTLLKRGQRLGLVGDTGLTTGPHLHFELRRDGDPLDPEDFLKPWAAPLESRR